MLPEPGKSKGLPDRGRMGWQVCRQSCRKTWEKVVVVQAPDGEPVAVEAREGKGCDRESCRR